MLITLGTDGDVKLYGTLQSTYLIFFTSKTLPKRSFTKRIYVYFNTIRKQKVLF